MTNIDLVSEDGTLPPQKVIVDYDKLPMRCKACHSWKHRVRDCNETQKRFVKSGRRPTYAQHTYQQEKGKNIIMDEEGFQQVKNRKSTRKNIFDVINDEERSSAYALAEEARAARNRTKSLAGETSRMRDLQAVPENPAAMNQERGANNPSLPQAIQGYAEVSGQMNVDGRQIHVERQEASTGGLRRVIPSTDEMAMEIDTAAETVNLASPVEGRGDPTSTMLWSPRKHAGQKRPLEREASEEEESDTESAGEYAEAVEGFTAAVEAAVGEENLEVEDPSADDLGAATVLTGKPKPAEEGCASDLPPTVDGGVGQLRKEVTSEVRGQKDCPQEVTTATRVQTEASEEGDFGGGQAEEIMAEDVRGRVEAVVEDEAAAAASTRQVAILQRESQRLEPGVVSNVAIGATNSTSPELPSGEVETQRQNTEGNWPTRTVQWRREARERPPKDGNIWRQQAWEAAPVSFQVHTSPLNPSKWTGSYPINDFERITSSFPEGEASHIITSRPPEVIRETQPLPKSKKRVCTRMSWLA